MNQIHPTAIISPEARLGDNVAVRAHAVIEAGVVVGDGCTLRERAHICSGTTLGKNCVIHMNAVIGNDPQDLSYKGAPLKTILGDNVTIRENVTIHGSPKESGTVLGNNCFLMAGSHVAHDCQLGNGVIMANGVLLAGHVQVGDSAFISGNVVVHQFVKIGRLAMLSGQSGFGMDVPPYLIGDGVNSITFLNAVGLRRSPLITLEDRNEIKQAYKLLYRSDLDFAVAIDRVAAEFHSPGVKHWVEFFRAPTKRGFCRFSLARRRGEKDEE